MIEKLFINFHDPDATEIISSLPHKIELHDTWLELFTKNNIVSPDEDSGISKEWNVEIRTTIRKDRIDGVDMYWSNDKKCPAVRLYIATNCSTFYIKTTEEQLQVYTKLQSWLTK